MPNSRLIAGGLILGMLLSQQTVLAQAEQQQRRRAPAARQPEDEEKNDITLTSPAIKGTLRLRVSGRKIVFGAGQLVIDGKTFDITPNKVSVPPPGFLSVADDPIRFVADEKPSTTSVLSKCRATTNDAALLRGVLVPGSVSLRNEAGPLKKDKDFTVTDQLGAVTLVAGGGIKPGDKAIADYKCWRRRIDTIAFDPASSSFVLLQGVPARSGPEPPVLDSALLALANVYSDWGGGIIDPANVMPISETTFTPNQKLIEHNRKAMEPIIKKLESGEQVTVVYWGDGITLGMDARSRDATFARLFAKQIKTAFPNAKLAAHNLGVPTSTTATRLPLMKQDVFALKPDVLIVEFCNDFGLNTHVLQHNYEEILDLCKENKVRVVLVAPGIPSPRIAKATSWEAVAERPYTALLKELAINNEYVAMADVFGRFVHLKQEGLRPEMLYVNGLNNPNNMGHAIYADEIVRCFTSVDQIASQKK